MGMEKMAEAPSHYRRHAKLAGLPADHRLVRLAERERARLMRRLGEILDQREGWLVEVAVLNRVMCEVERHPRS